jgi:cycloeucalenol cycloisomerase
MSTMGTGDLPIEAVMTAILATGFAILVGLHFLQIPWQSHSVSQDDDAAAAAIVVGNISLPLQLPHPITEPSKYCHEIFTWRYSLVWMGIFGCVVITQIYETYNAYGYLVTCGGLALPLLLQPWLHPRASCLGGVTMVNPDVHRPLHQRYSTKVVVYLGTYSFIGNYWYTHYFYSVLHAKYTMPAHRLNDVPIAMYLATHFYFSTYHACISNGILRYVDRRYASGWRKSLLFWYSVLFLSYLTAFMETLTISSFPYYSFEDRTMAYIWGSAFYGIYFIVSFPGFYYFDSHIDAAGILSTKDGVVQQPNGGGRSVTLMDAFVTACGHGMIILTLLDFVRLHLGIPLVIGGVAFAAT